jgi:S1-C subfamily serine protease
MLPRKKKRGFYVYATLFITILILTAGCSAFRHGYTTQEYAHQMLPASVGRGAERLEMEVKFSSVIRGYVQNRRFPDYIYVASNKKLHLIYIKDDLFVTFNRTRTSIKSTIITEENIPDAMLALVSWSDQQRVLSARSGHYPESVKGSGPKRKIGTGFAVSPDGLILTAHHIIAHAVSIRVHLSGDRVFEARVERSSPSTDLVLLRIDAQTPVYLIPAFTHSLLIGKRVFTIGYPVVGLLGEEPKFSEGSIASLSGPSGDAMFMQISVPVQPGNSGGPLVTERGELVGIVVASADVVAFITATGSLPQNVNWAVKADYARALLSSPGSPNAFSSREEAIKHVRRSVCLIEVITGP